MGDASAQELLLLSALQECRIRLDAARRGEELRESAEAALREALSRERALADELARERERTAAVRAVLDALAASTGRFGLRRSDFLARVARAGRETPDTGAAAARHPVLLAEARRVLGVAPDADPGPADPGPAA